jgi:hypothetical protein
MHDTSLRSGEAFSFAYGVPNGLVVDIGGRNVNGSLRSFFESKGMKFICVDMEEHESVDVVVSPGDKLPFEDGSVDKEMTRIIKPTGFIYINAPTTGPYHTYPGDNWRFYSDAGQALAFWSGKQVANETIYPVQVIETFNVLGSEFNDFVCVWQRVEVENMERDIVTPHRIVNKIGILEHTINRFGLRTRKKC